MKTPKTFYKYRGFDVNSLSSLCDNTLYFSHPGEFNDPLDCSPTIERDSSLEELKDLHSFFINKRISAEILEGLKKAKVKLPDSNHHANEMAARQALKDTSFLAFNANNPNNPLNHEETLKKFLVSGIQIELQQWFESGVFCLSSNFHSQLLWSHYGNQHKGICIGYQLNKRFPLSLQRVIYGGNRSIKTSDLVKAYLNDNLTVQEQVKRDVLMRKAKGWEYEEEWRIIGKQGLQPSPLSLTEVIFGLRCPTPVKHAVIQSLIPKNNDVKFYEIHTAPHTFRLYRRQITSAKVQSELGTNSFVAL